MLVKNLAEISVFLGAGLFLIGWSYLYGYYRGFGISADNIDLSLNSVLIHSMPVIGRLGFLCTCIVALVVLVIGGEFGVTGRILAKPASMFLLVVIAGLAASQYALYIGREAAWQDAHLSTSTLPYVVLQGIEEGGGLGCGLGEANYKLLLQSHGQVIVVLPVDDTRQVEAPNIRVCSFPESRIQALRIQVGLDER